MREARGGSGPPPAPCPGTHTPPSRVPVRSTPSSPRGDGALTGDPRVADRAARSSAASRRAPPLGICKGRGGGRRARRGGARTPTRPDGGWRGTRTQSLSSGHGTRDTGHATRDMGHGTGPAPRPSVRPPAGGRSRPDSEKGRLPGASRARGTLSSGGSGVSVRAGCRRVGSGRAGALTA